MSHTPIAMNHREDHRLARRMMRGSESAFEQFFEQLFPVVFRFSLGRCGGDHDAAEEATQITLTRAVHRIHTFRAEASLLTWTLSICRRVLVDEFGRRQRRLETPLEDLDHETRSILESLAAPEAPAQSTEQRALRQLIRRALDVVPPRQRLALEGRYLQGHSVREIARHLDVTEKAAESLLSRGRAALREAFEVLEATHGRSTTP